MPVDQRLLDQIALSRDEYALLVERLEREPNGLELGIVGALWSEHCGYKNSRPLLGLFPTRGEHVLTRAGEENAGAIDVGDGLCVVFKIESHNHPSAIEPFQGAATGVGGIVRDIFAMGAQPIALLDSLRFGPLTASEIGDTEAARNRYLLAGVVGGIGGYGNCLGVPTVGGETFFDASYSGNPLVNAMCVGVAPIGGLRTARADGPGNPLILVGADTGRDGIHGATFASVQLDERSQERRPAVQVGNPFLEKLLMEACQELARTDWIVGLQDLGAAGLTSASIECASRSGTGLEIDVARVPRREAGMTPYEVMLSESQERMLVIARRGCEEQVAQLFRHWDLQTAIIGRVTDDGVVRVLDGDTEVAHLPVPICTSPPQYRREGVPAPWMLELQAFEVGSLPDLASPPGPLSSEAGEGEYDGTAGEERGGRELTNAEMMLLRLLASPNIASKRWIFRQYDHQVLTNTVQGPGGDAAVLRLKGTRRGIALTVDGSGRLCRLDPFVGGAIAVAEAARNLVCVGADPLAATDCLNFGNPEKPDVYFQLEQAIRGMSAACDALATPVVSGNVSLYNETLGRSIDPTPVVGMVGLLEDVALHSGAGFCGDGDQVYLLAPERSAPVGSLAGSEYLALVHGVVAGQPELNLDFEVRLQRCVREGVRQRIIASAHDCSEGGLAVTLAECCLEGARGLDASAVPVEGRYDAALFGEQQSRVVVSAHPGQAEALRDLAAAHRVPCISLGVVTGDRLRLTGQINLPLYQIASVYDTAFAAALGEA
jgi:phosphoribosylformylglycinamidine (FGAM) synthase-like enzyme